MSQKVRSKYGVDSKPRFYMKIIFIFLRKPKQYLNKNE